MPAVLTFSEKQAKFVSEFLVDSNGTQAAIRAGYSASGARVTAHRLLTNDAIYGAIEAQRLADAARLSLRREDVLAGLLEAVDTARLQQNPMAMVSGLRELGRMMGFYAPEVRRVELTADQHITQNHMSAMTVAELLALMQGRTELVLRAVFY